MSVKLIEVKIEMGPYEDVILKQLMQTDEQEPQWHDQNISASAGIPNSPEKDSMNGEEAFLLGIAMSQGIQTSELRERLQKGETICLYQRPEISGQGSS